MDQSKERTSFPISCRHSVSGLLLDWMLVHSPFSQVHFPREAVISYLHLVMEPLKHLFYLPTGMEAMPTKEITSAWVMSWQESDSRVCSPMLSLPKPESTGLGFPFLDLHCRNGCSLSYLRYTSLSKELGSVLLLIYYLKSTWLGWFYITLRTGAL